MQQARKWSRRSWAATLILALLLGAPGRALGQGGASGPPQSPDLGEADRLYSQAKKLYDERRYAEAIPFAERALAIREKALGPDHVEVAMTLINLAVLYEENGDYARADPMHLRGLEILERRRGAEFNYGFALNEFAVALSKRGDAAGAVRVYELAVQAVTREYGPDTMELAQVLSNLGHAYRAYGDYRQAALAHQRSLAIREIKQGSDNVEVGQTLNSLAAVLRLLRDFKGAEQHYERALKIFERLEGPESEWVATVSDNLGMVYKDLGDFTRAEQSHLRALTLFKKLHGPENLDVATALSNLGLVYADTGEDARAEDMFKQALAIRRKVLGEGHSDTAIAIDNLAVFYQETGNYAAAEKMHRSALEAIEKQYGPEHPFTAEFVSNLAGFYRNTGDYVQAEKLYRRVLAIVEKRFGATHGKVVPALNLLADVLVSKGDLVEATLIYRRSVETAMKALEPTDAQALASLSGLASVYEKIGYDNEAERLREMVLKIRMKVHGKDNPAMYGEYGIYYLRKGDFDKAEQFLLAFLANEKELHGEEHPKVLDATMALALMYHTRGMYARAEELYRRTLAVEERQLDPDHPKVGDVLFYLAVLNWANGDIEKSLPLLKRATDIYERNLAVILATGSDRQKSFYVMTTTPPTAAAITLNVHSAPNDPVAARIALTSILRRKGRVMDAMTDQFGALHRRLDPRDRALFDQLMAAQKSYANFAYKTAEHSNPEQHREQLNRLEGEVEELEAQISSRSAEFRAQSEPVTVESIQRVIPEGAALVEISSYSFYNAKHKADESLYGTERYVAYVLRREGQPTFVDLGEAAPIDQAVLRFRAALSNHKSTDVKHLARALDELVMRPVRKLLGKTRMVLLSPDGQLNLVPFAALVDEQGRYLVENYTFNYLTSGRDLLRLDTQAQSRQQPMVLANPTFDVGVTNNGRNVTETDAAKGRRSNDFKTLGSISPLPGTAQEAAAIKSIVPSAQVLTESAATEAALKSVAGPRFLHIATHGFFFKDQPRQTADLSRRISMPDMPQAVQGENPLLRSGLVLAGVSKGQSGPGEDGVLTALEVAGLDLWGTKLVVLSACDTAVGDTSNGEGVYGLRRALVMAGAESQLMSLWPVGDKATRDLMIDYYRRLVRGEGRTEALRAAQLEMLAGNKREGQVGERRIGAASPKGVNYSHPYYWASFIPIGDWRPINKPAQPSSQASLPTVTMTPQPVMSTKPIASAPQPAPVPRAAAPQTGVAGKTAAQRSPGSFEAQMRAASDFYKSGNLSEAASSLQRALTLKPNDVDTLTMMGNVQYDAGDFAGAASFYQRSLALRPNNAAVRADLGNTYFYRATPDYDGAIAEYRKALKISPKDEKVWQNIIVVALWMKNGLIAHDAINQLAEINPSNPELQTLRLTLAAMRSGANRRDVLNQTIKVVKMHR